MPQPKKLQAANQESNRLRRHLGLGAERSNGPDEILFRAIDADSGPEEEGEGEEGPPRYRVVMTAAACDRVRDVVVPSGLDSTAWLATGGAIFLNHESSELPIANAHDAWVETIKIRGREVEAKLASISYLPADLHPGAELVRRLQTGDGLPGNKPVMRGFSITFRPKANKKPEHQNGPPTEEEAKQFGPDAVWVWRSSEQLELSSVGVPAMPLAVMLGEESEKGLAIRRRQIMGAAHQLESGGLVPKLAAAWLDRTLEADEQRLLAAADALRKDWTRAVSGWRARLPEAPAKAAPAPAEDATAETPEAAPVEAAEADAHELRAAAAPAAQTREELAEAEAEAEVPPLTEDECRSLDEFAEELGSMVRAAEQMLSRLRSITEGARARALQAKNGSGNIADVLVGLAQLKAALESQGSSTTAATAGATTPRAGEGDGQRKVNLGTLASALGFDAPDAEPPR